MAVGDPGSPGAGTDPWGLGLDSHALQAPQPSPSPLRTGLEDLPDLWPPIHLAEEVGARLGEREVLLGSVPRVEVVLNSFDAEAQSKYR